MSILLVQKESPTLPEWCERELLKLGGRTEGGLPVYRLIWGASKVITPDDVTSYYKPDRWHLEKWHEGNYQHCYTYGYCPHMKAGDTRWCNPCWLSGGEFIGPESHWRIFERAVRMLVMTEQFQKSSADKGARMERDALMKREKDAEEAAAAKRADVLTGNLSAIDRVPHSLSPRGSKSIKEFEMPLHAGQVLSPRKKKMPKGGDIKQV